MSNHEVTARVAILVDVTLTEPFDDSSTASSIFDSAKRQAKLIEDMVVRYGGAGGKARMTFCNEPKVCLVIANE